VRGKVLLKETSYANRSFSLYGFPTKKQAQAKEYIWQKSVVTKFFKIGWPMRTQGEAQEIYQLVENQVKDSNTAPIALDNRCRRSFIIALTKILTKYGKMPRLSFKLGSTAINFVPDANALSTVRQKGNFKMEIPALGIYQIAYGEGCYNRMKYLLNPTWDTHNMPLRRNALAKFISAKLPIFRSFSYGEFNKYGNIIISSDTVAATAGDRKVLDNIHFLNGLIFLITVTEVLVRLYRTEDGNIYSYSSESGVESDSFPVALAQARSLLMLLNGKINYTDFIGQSVRDNYDGDMHRAYYGAVTGQHTINNIEMMLEKLFAINALYDREKFEQSSDHVDLRDKYLHDNSKGHLIEGRSMMYFELRRVYGSGNESDSDSDGYSSDDEDTKDSVPFKLNQQ
jgi:hypothetical protein